MYSKLWYNGRYLQGRDERRATGEDDSKVANFEVPKEKCVLGGELVTTAEECELRAS